MGPLAHDHDEGGGRTLATLLIAFLPPPSAAFVLPVASRNDCCTAHIALRMGLHCHRTAKGCRPSFLSPLFVLALVHTVSWLSAWREKLEQGCKTDSCARGRGGSGRLAPPLDESSRNPGGSLLAAAPEAAPQQPFQPTRKTRHLVRMKR